MGGAAYRTGTVRRFVYHWFRRETVVRALKVASVVGPVLTLINQYDVLMRLEFSPRLLAKIFLTFLVPYGVSSFSSARAYLENEARAESAKPQNAVEVAGAREHPRVEISRRKELEDDVVQ